MQSRQSDQSLPSEALAFWLRDMRRSSGASLDELARRTGYSRTVLSDACSGRRAVSLPVLEALVQACGEDSAAWREYWLDIRRRVDAGDRPERAELLAPPWRRAAIQDLHEREPQAADSGSLEPLRRAGGVWTRRPVVVGAAAVLVAGVAVAVWLGAEGAESATYVERQFNRNGGPTFRDPAGVADPGLKIPFGKDVEVACKVLEPSIPSVSPDGYWYRIKSPPWNGEYYAAANTFLNDDPEEGPYTHNTDFDVPDCADG